MKPGVRVDQGPRDRAADEGAACETFPVKAFPVSSGATVCRKDGRASSARKITCSSQQSGRATPISRGSGSGRFLVKVLPIFNIVVKQRSYLSGA